MSSTWVRCAVDRGVRCRHAAVLGGLRRRHASREGSAADVRLFEQDRGEIARILSEAVPVAGPSPEGM
jgi:hypothetical protein